MTLMSRSEFQSLFKRAARAANVPLSQREEAAAMVGRLAQNEFEQVLAQLVDILDTPRRAPDGAQNDGVWYVGGADPLQSIPAALDLAQAGERVRHAPNGLLDPWAAFRGFCVGSDGFIAFGTPTNRATGHVTVPKDAIDRLGALAALTYVRSTDESREGAGAGNIDND